MYRLCVLYKFGICSSNIILDLTQLAALSLAIKVVIYIPRPPVFNPNWLDVLGALMTDVLVQCGNYGRPQYDNMNLPAKEG